MGTLFLVSLISFKAFRYIISVLGSVKILQRKGPIKGITCNGELGTRIKPFIFKSNYIFYVANHSFVVFLYCKLSYSN